MTKIKLGKTALVFPMPALLIGSKSGESVNFATFAWAGIVNSEPPMIGVGIRKSRYTHELISKSGVFSVNIPSDDQAKETDFCGIRSGRKVNKVDRCGFDVFYGELEDAPLIAQCPMNIECRVEKVVTLPTHDYFIGSVVEVHLDENLAVDKKKEHVKINPLVFMGTHYAGVYGDLGKAYSVGKTLSKVVAEASEI